MLFRRKSPLRFSVLLVSCAAPTTAWAQTQDSSPSEGEIIEISVGPASDPAATEEPAQAGAEPQPPAEPQPAEATVPGTETRVLAAAPPERAPAEPAEITVAGSRLSRLAGSGHVVKQKQLERFEYDDPHAVFAQVPGVYVRQEDGFGLRPNLGIRGVNSDRSKKVTLLEDGVLLGPAPYSAPAAYYFPILTRMTQVRVVKGPAAVAYGPQTVGGAVDLITRPIPVSPTGKLDLALGQYGYTKAHGHFGASSEQFGFLVEGVRLSADGFKELPSGGDTGFTRNEWMVKTQYVVDPSAAIRNELRLKLSYSDEDSNETYLGLTDADFARNPNRRYAASALDRMVNHRTGVVLTHVLGAPEAGLTLTTNAYHFKFERVWRKLNRFGGTAVSDVLSAPEDPSNADYYAVLTGEADSTTSADQLFIGPNDRGFVSQGVESVFDLERRTGPLQHRIQSGVRVHHDRIRRRHSEAAYRMVGGELFPEAERSLLTTVNEANSYALALHLQDAITWRALTVTPGIRLEAIHSELDDQLTGEQRGALVQAVMPGLGAFYSLTESWGVLAGVYRGFSPPPPASDRTTEPEYSVNYEAGTRLSRGRGRAEVIGFYNDYSNLTDICTLASGCLSDDLDRQFDAGEARIYGFEASAEQEFPLGKLKLPASVSYTLTRGEFARSFESDDPIYGDVAEGDEMPYLPRHQLYAMLALEHARAGGGVGVAYSSRMREEASGGALEDVLATDELVTVDVSSQVKVWGPLTIYGNVRNLLNDQSIVSRRPYGARPNAPRWVQVGAKIEL
jgi:Fe(3+) dicitrate transport protein